MQRVLIRGQGIAASCCAHLLGRAGHEVRAAYSERAQLPAIMLGDAATALIEDVFDRPGIFGQFHRIRKRVVAWGRAAEPVTVPHSAVVVSEAQLLGAVSGEISTGDGDADWSIYTARPLPLESRETAFGTRRAAAVAVGLNGEADACWIESMDEGWLFLIPNGERAGWLLAVGGGVDELLGASRWIAGRVGELLGAASEFPAYPRTMSPLCGEGWIACGSAAMAFDPICGDGTANAAREAILASAVVTEGPAAFGHYEARLTAGFQKHLAMCMAFYRPGHGGPWWDREAAALDEGLAWCAKRQREIRGEPYQLRGFELARMLT